MSGNAVLLLGCPEVPIQTAIVLYIASRLKESGIDAIAAGTPSALSLLKISDPKKHYVSKMIDLDQCIEDLVEKRVDFDLCFVFVHNDAGISYAATMERISGAELFVIIFGREALSLAEEVGFKCEKIVSEAVHNPVPLKHKVDRVMGWDVSKR
jgi:hypothetical protein